MAENTPTEKKVNFPAYRWFVLFTSCFAVGTLYIHMTAISPILGVIAEELNLDIGKASQFFTARMLGEAVFMVSLGFVCDRCGLTKALLIGLVIALLSVLFTPWWGNSYWGFLTLRFFQGGSVGCIFPTVGYVAAHWFPEKEHGVANGLFFGSVCVGSAIGAVLAPLINGAVNNWQWTVAILGIFNVIGMVFAFMVANKNTPIHELVAEGAVAPVTDGMSYGETLKFPITWLGALIVFANAWIFFGLTNFIPVFLAEPKPMGVGVGPVIAGYLNLALTLIGIVAVLFGGWFYDLVMKGHAKPPVAAGFILSGVAFVLILPEVQTSMFLIVFVLMVAGFGIPFQLPALSAYVVKIYPPEVSGQMIGWWFGVGTFGAAAGLFFGSISLEETGSFAWAIKMISIAAFVGFMLTVAFLKHKLRLKHHRII